MRAALAQEDGSKVVEKIEVMEPGTPTVETGYWTWRGYKIRYQQAGGSGPVLLLVHGFGANCDHWRKNMPYLARTHRVFAIDLLGYGYSDKPNPRDFPEGTLYTFETWAQQLLDFCDQFAGGPVFMICNSVGGLAGLQAAIDRPEMVRGLVLLNISLRMLHITKQEWWKKPFVKAVQTVLRGTNLGQSFFKSLASKKAVKSILQQAYHDDSAVTDELVDFILTPGLQPGAADVFLDFICYSFGPLPEELIPRATCPILIGWGEKDPWEPVELGRAYGEFDNVEEFVVLPNVGHCPQDEAPDLVNALVEKFVAKHFA
ncbi:alpha/beta-hydrolases superfamily protein [Klebsormidium nitens]|uniref:Alpha/beta-hydrolases superfamily protein n=1 Tax=Klebsormidium nitens TaxID=105231 RepID=A0A0U9I6K7_KLENI|nr:alpha/beta-hydrolases superfamily protein [Klebsormidium nitens]|eukprot:GAQ80233.1 alpha/beta-hydrolases superfamily protein [Klebsormidium nitens]